MLTVAAIATLFEPPPVKTDASGGGDTFAPLIAGLLDPVAAPVNGKSLPPPGGSLPGAAEPPSSTDAPTPAPLPAGGTTPLSDLAAPSRFAGDGPAAPARDCASPLTDTPAAVIRAAVLTAAPGRQLAATVGPAPTAAPTVIVQTGPSPSLPAAIRPGLKTPSAAKGNMAVDESSADDDPIDTRADQDSPAAQPADPLAPSPSLIVAGPLAPPPAAMPAAVKDVAVAPTADAARPPSTPATATAAAGIALSSSPLPPPPGPSDQPATSAPVALANPAAIAAGAPLFARKTPLPVDAAPMAQIMAAVAPSAQPDAGGRTTTPGLESGERGAVVTPAPVAITPAAGPVILPALQAFGAAMRQAFADERKPARQPGEVADTVTGVATAAAPATPQPVANGAATLDTADRRWPHAMAEQIERLRDAADSQSTRIRLLPDALGPVDVAVRRDGEQVHVHFTATQAETRQLLADAQPRLADAAEARGLKLGRTDVSGGDLAGGDRQQQRPATQNPQPARPAPARPGATVTDATDSRLA